MNITQKQLLCFTFWSCSKQRSGLHPNQQKPSLGLVTMQAEDVKKKKMRDQELDEEYCYCAL